MGKVIKCRIIDERENSLEVIVPVPNHPNRQRRVFLPLSQTDKLVRAGALVRRDTVYCDSVTVPGWLAEKEDL